MKLPVGFPDASTLRGLAAWLQKLASSIVSGWNVEHRDNGRHKFPWVDYEPGITGDGAMTWTSPTITLARYVIIDQKMTIMFDISGTVGGTPTDALLVELPPGYAASLPYGAATFAYLNTTSSNGLVFSLGRQLWFYQTIGGTPWTAGSARVVGSITCQVEKE